MNMDVESPFDLLGHAAAAFVRRVHKNLIGATWMPAATGETLEVIDPGTGDVVGHIPASGAPDVDAAVAAARAALETGPWSRMTGQDRAADVETGGADRRRRGRAVGAGIAGYRARAV
jgi:acyl-CoA reductase-like NAD-dependent aldehyde dehydrogenase